LSANLPFGPGKTPFYVKARRTGADTISGAVSSHKNVKTSLQVNIVKVEDIASNAVAFELQREPQMNGELQAVIDIATEKPDCNIILDFAYVDIITSSSLTKLLKLRQTLLASGRRVILCGLHPFTRSAFEVTGLNGVFELAADKQAGLSILFSGRLAGS
jgi:anti-anti-sigma factor